ncbi:MAG: dephospho-CoA kinase [Bacteroidetes bacterium CG2_30_32_10]|nr:MAG: dephospho-CoA kinase [Bacteroidetes bacterium CG2_30_32_10]
MLKVGLTGNIGSGKSTISNIFSILGVSVYNADNEAKKILDSPNTIPELLKNFGIEIVNSDNTINKKKLAEIVFNNKAKLNKLNAIIHPLVMDDFNKWCLQFTDAAYVINESAILVEAGLYKQFDKLITVISPEIMRIERVMKRDSCEREKVIERINNQLKEEEKMKVSDFIINNNEKDLVIPQVLLIHKALSF